MTTTKTLTLLVGPPGSGKSTTSTDLAYLQQGTYEYINQDSQGKKEHYKIFEDAIRKETQYILIDRMNFNREQRERYLKPAKDAGYYTKIMVLHESYDTCLERCSKRIDHPTIKDEKTAKKVLNFFFTKYERVEDNEADEVIRIWPSFNKPDAVWIDMDNTLSNASHREHFLDKTKGKPNWKAFFDACVNDSINEWCSKIINSMQDSVDILICSARPDDYKKHTEEWLITNKIHYNDIIMRRRNDFRPDFIVKEIMYEFEVKTKYNLLFSIDDRKQVIDQIRKHGVIVLDCAGEKGHF